MSRTTKILFTIIGIIIFTGFLVGVYFLGKSKSSSTAKTTGGSNDTAKSGSAAQDPNGPYYHKIYAATSKDGLTWNKQDKVLFDHASVPGAVIKDGVIYLYFVDAGDSAGDQLSVGISKDSGKTFDKQKIVIKDSVLSAVDPDPILLSSGKIRLYYFASPVVAGDPAKTEGEHQIMSAQSSDGINFDGPQKVFAEENITDPDVVQTAKDWRLFVSKGTAMDLAVSSDGGATFQKQNNFSWNGGGVSGTADTGGTLRTYYCDKGGIGSATGIETGKLTAETGARIEGQPNEIVCDPSVIQLPDKTFLMFYKVQAITQNSNNNQSAPAETIPGSSPDSTTDSDPKPPDQGGTTDSAGGPKGPSTNTNSQQNSVPPK